MRVLSETKLAAIQNIFSQTSQTNALSISIYIEIKMKESLFCQLLERGNPLQLTVLRMCGNLGEIL